MRIRIKEALEIFEIKHGYKLTQKRLAELVLMKSGGSIRSKLYTLNKMERGKMSHPPLDVVDKICFVCDVPLDWIIDRQSKYLLIKNEENEHLKTEAGESVQEIC